MCWVKAIAEFVVPRCANGVDPHEYAIETAAVRDSGRCDGGEYAIEEEQYNIQLDAVPRS